MAGTRRRQAGEGGFSECQTMAGPRSLVKYAAQRAVGTKRVVLKRGFRTRREAAAGLRAVIRRTEMGEWVEPSEQRLDAYLAEWMAAQRLRPSTVSSYRENTSTCTPAWDARPPTASQHCSTVDRAAKCHTGTTKAFGAQTGNAPGP